MIHPHRTPKFRSAAWVHRRCHGIGGPQGAAADGAPTAERPDPGEGLWIQPGKEGMKSRNSGWELKQENAAMNSRNRGWSNQV